MRSAAKRVEQIIGLRVWFSLRPRANMSKLSKSHWHGELEPAHPHSIPMHESKDMREKNIEPEIYRDRDVKVISASSC